MAVIPNIRFNLSKIQTDEFALLAESYESNMPVTVNIGFGFNFAKENNTIGALVKCTFLQHDKVLLVVAASCWFRIDAEDFKTIYDPVERQFTLLLPHAIHFGGFTVGTVRGVLHAKTEKHALNGVVLPPVNVNEIIKAEIKVMEAVAQG